MPARFTASYRRRKEMVQVLHQYGAAAAADLYEISCVVGRPSVDDRREVTCLNPLVHRNRGDTAVGTGGPTLPPRVLDPSEGVDAGASLWLKSKRVTSGDTRIKIRPVNARHAIPIREVQLDVSRVACKNDRIRGV